MADARGGKDLYEEKWGKGQTLWVFGSEGLGVSEKALELSDLTLLIPLDSRVESLNVATAASVCLFEQRRRRLSGIAAQIESGRRFGRISKYRFGPASHTHVRINIDFEFKQDRR